MSRQRKTAAVLRLLRDRETVSRGLGVTAATLTGWRDAFLAEAADPKSLRERASGARTKAGELSMPRKAISFCPRSHRR
jgi:hypothetical protein